MKRMLITAGLFGLVACTATSPTGRDQILMFSADEMRTMGDQSFEQIKQKEKISTDKAINAYVQCVTAALTKPEHLQAIDASQTESWDLVVFDSDQVNAFALPGGHIGVYTGLLKAAQTPDQLAAVIGHEIGHVLADHGNEQVSRGQATEMGMQMIQVALGATGTPNQDMIMAGLGLGAQYGVILPFGRQQESESDVIGIELMARAGFDPAQSITLWQNMAKASGGSAQPEFMSTHPSHDTRITELSNRQPESQALYKQAQQQGYRPSCKVP
ncbi:M48 family metallopeptidase [Ferrimonas lipolytica]|uniref:M48 family metallopeptidase n=1 Tax=Ferrimonas lipolytica TaxID=2724191 RepID=A0A6H1UC20_9GAMM|nr:M48 family metallopeptidase [Ferrimonas lipolytica]QIZ75913.1 M48 family metallopeptidase [Ferrimonas lipolytica]